MSQTLRKMSKASPSKGNNEAYHPRQAQQPPPEIPPDRQGPRGARLIRGAAVPIQPAPAEDQARICCTNVAFARPGFVVDSSPVRAQRAKRPLCPATTPASFPIPDERPAPRALPDEFVFPEAPQIHRRTIAPRWHQLLLQSTIQRSRTRLRVCCGCFQFLRRNRLYYR